MMTDEEVIKRRLLIDGDGTGDDRRLNVLLKTFVKWSYASDLNENNQMMYDRLLAQLIQCDFAVTKTDFAAKMMKQELKHYEAISNKIECNIEMAKNEIDSSKGDLKLAKQIRKNRMEYDALAKVINSQADRKRTAEQLGTLKTDLLDLKGRSTQLQNILDTRKNDFVVLMRSIKELQNRLEGTSDDDEMIAKDADIIENEVQLIFESHIPK